MSKDEAPVADRRVAGVAPEDVAPERRTGEPGNPYASAKDETPRG